MKWNSKLCVAVAMICLCAGAISPVQEETEKTSQAVVRDKHYYKAGKFELGVGAGLAPYDSLVNHYFASAHGTWHFSDHYAWQIASVQYGFPQITNYTINTLAQGKNLDNLQVTSMKIAISTNFMVSPIYGKFRLFGKGAGFFDLYLSVGGGVASTELTKVAVGPTTSVLRSGFEPMANIGLGFKFFLTDTFGLQLDLRDFLTYSQFYNGNVIRSYYTAIVGICLFLPSFG